MADKKEDQLMKDQHEERLVVPGLVLKKERRATC